MSKANKNFVEAASLFAKFKLKDKGGYITREFQDFGYRLACELDDEKRASLYIKLAKTTNRAILEKARAFVIDAPKVKSKAALFLWKLRQLKQEKNHEK